MKPILLYALAAAFLLGPYSCSKNALLLKEEKAINDYLQNKLLGTTPSASGLYYIEDLSPEEADPQAVLTTPSVGDTVVFSMVGRMLTLPSGGSYQIYYQSPTDTPLKFVYGKDHSIQGLEEALGLVRKGVVARLLVPSALAYGTKKQGVVPPYTPLLIELTIHDIR